MFSSTETTTQEPSVTPSAVTLTEARLEVLVVEDDIDVAGMVEARLRRNGYLVRTAASGHAALNAVALRRPDLVLLDIGLPDLDGWEVARLLRSDETTADLPIVIMSIIDQPINPLVRADGYLAKPFSMQTLEAAVASLLGGSRSTESEAK